jgi:hypothetical protein
LSASLPAAIQRRLVSLYALEAIPPVDDFVATSREVERERVLVRHDDEGVALSVELPPAALEAPLDLDRFCQLVEGVSHFVLLAERALRDRTTTQLELELQAEVDKYVLLTALDAAPSSTRRIRAFQRLFDEARFRDPPGTELGDRYRLAHRLAAKLVQRFERQYLRSAKLSELWAALRRFYRLDQAGKIALAT